MRRLAIALAVAAAACAAAPAAHAARTDDLSKPVLLVAGPERSSCDAFEDFEVELGEYTVTASG
jgi:hypothetical protein